MAQCKSQVPHWHVCNRSNEWTRSHLLHCGGRANSIPYSLFKKAHRFATPPVAATPSCSASRTPGSAATAASNHTRAAPTALSDSKGQGGYGGAHSERNTGNVGALITGTHSLPHMTLCSLDSGLQLCTTREKETVALPPESLVPCATDATSANSHSAHAHSQRLVVTAARTQRKTQHAASSDWKSGF